MNLRESRDAHRRLDVPFRWFLSVLLIMSIGLAIDFFLYQTSLINVRVMVLLIFILGIDSVFVTAMLGWIKYKGMTIRKERTVVR
ncbi:MAG: hypothetical protein HXX80_02710 [Nitrososphaerales archaeon]|nr:hypothetical protein [Nitrososphaerales archaeon]